MPQRNTAQPEPEYGKKKEVQDQEAAMAQAEAMAASATPQPGAPPQSENPVQQAMAPEPPAPQPGQGTMPQQAPGAIRIGNPAMLLPPNVNFPQRKTQMEENYDAAMMFSLLGSRDPVFAEITKELSGE